jgi:protein gp37
MAATSSIEWTDTTWNPVSGCTRASAGCDNCYAVTMTHRLEAMGQAKYSGLTVLNAKGGRHFNGVVRTHDDSLAIPLKWRKPRRVFVNSMSDPFHKDVPFDFIDQVFAVMALTPQHTYQVLTKRPERMAEYLATRPANRVGPRRRRAGLGSRDPALSRRTRNRPT